MMNSDGISGGTKFDTGKPEVSLISSAAILEEARVMGFGAKKYSRDNWREGIAYSRCLSAAMRHILAYNSGEKLDPETGISHLAHARCCLAFVLEFDANYQTYSNFDDIYTPNP